MINLYSFYRSFLLMKYTTLTIGITSLLLTGLIIIPGCQSFIPSGSEKIKTSNPEKSSENEVSKLIPGCADPENDPLCVTFPGGQTPAPTPTPPSGGIIIPPA
jgi:hypothetical protein